MNDNCTSEQAISRVAIVGAGIAGWTVAATLARSFKPENLLITLIDLGNQNASVAAESTLPSILSFNAMLGLEEKSVMKASEGTFKLATHYQNWSNAQASVESSFHLPFSNHGFMLNRIDFSGYAIALHQQDNNMKFSDYSLAATASALGRFKHPSTEDKSLFSTLKYALHLDLNKYQTLLKEYASNKGVNSVSAGSIAVQLSDNGSIEQINCSHDDKSYSIDADLFIDCTGHEGQLIDGALNNPYQDFSDCIKSNRSVKLIRNSLNDIAPTTHLRASADGWFKQIPLKNNTSTEFFYNDQLISDQQALEKLQTEVGRKDDDNVYYRSLTPGKRQDFWYKNCIAIGDSAGYIGEFCVSQLHLIQSAALRLVSLFPQSFQFEMNAREYNRLTHSEYCHILDFHSLHSVLSPALKQENSQSISPTLAHKLSLFRNRGKLALYEDETLSADHWTALLLGCEQWPENFDPIIEGADPAWASQQLNKMKEMMTAAANSMPSHREYLNRYCG